MTANPAVTPRVGVLARRSVFWVVAAATVAAITLVVLTASGRAGSAPALDPASSTPDGARALVEVLRDGGVDVTAATTLAAAESSAASGATVLLYDPSAYLSERQLGELGGSGASFVLVDPDQTALDVFAPDVTFAGVPVNDGLVTAQCSYPPAARAESVPAAGSSYRAFSAEATGCFPTGDDAFAFVHVQSGAASVDVVGDTGVFTNDGITSDGRAALALGMLSRQDSVAWYLPTAADVEGTGPVSMAELTPPWITPAILLLVAVFLAAAVWRGRRFGPLIAESLPVVVHASETALGRARLYARSSARLRALDALRIGTTTRLSALLGLPASADLADVARAAAALLERDPAPIFAVLVGDIPRTDAELVRSSDELLRLEQAVVRALARTGLSADAPPPAPAPAPAPTAAPIRGNSTP
ncbi:DUF4350 domain-containing protein [Microbacteriaceae bacterium VKM Ac-2855]|nr:DUF4350 domain-containing protein [Microbacteriaceae bacterium VKM Ac-2855]